MAKKVADLLVENLVNAGVKRLYAVTGDSLNPINDAVRRDGRLEWIHVRHEEAGAYAASMDAELDGIGCCMGSSGPGHVHLINGLYDANRSGNPVIAIATTINTDKLGMDNFQETNIVKLFDDCSKYCVMTNTPEQAANAFQSAIQHAIQDRGVAVVGLPGDVSESEVTEITTANKNFTTHSRLIPGKEELKELAEVINTNKKVMLFCGYGCKDAQDEAMQLSEQLNAPMGYSFRGKIFFDKISNPFAVGLNGLLGSKSGFKAMQEADLLILLGTDFPYTDFLPEDNTIIQIDDKPERIGRRAKVDYGYAGKIKDTLEALLPLLDRKTDDDFLKAMRELHNDQEEKYASYVQAKSEGKNIHPEFVASVIDDVATDDAIFTVDTGMSAVWAARYIKGKRNRYLTGSFNHGSMANAMPMAIGAGLSRPDRQVIALCGDGGISMLLGDLMTISQYNIPVKIIIFNNRTLGMVKVEMLVAGYPDWQTDMKNPDFAKVAEAMGIKAWNVDQCENVQSTLEVAFAHNGPALINIFTDPDALAMPPKVEFDQIKGFTKSMGKLMLNGQVADVIDTAKSNMKYLKELF
ncbi:pyruvate dehydrogenase (quinone) [Winogradskyella epiphytica]|uniref:Pyruvate dehydrogenase (Quinone) n=1 Tax=Winogradskyella epiphytica TaxID=262005 RepID=A0A2V4WZ05_9FLAO|nr:thiamine pyrophosphate-dependent enzyme [Winogradskyella epiphytica]PYE82882.1 pyruvate dehydrogenase (quinone) [Winogradskyella epiphytica]GGW54350.1 pyruvate dehydrogenase [Winogradskyella epiphytica]